MGRKRKRHKGKKKVESKRGIEKGEKGRKKGKGERNKVEGKKGNTDDYVNEHM